VPVRSRLLPALLLACCLSAAAQEERKVTLSLKDVPFRSALAALFHGTTLQYSVDPNVPNFPVTMIVRDSAVPAALRLMVRQCPDSAPVSVSRDADVYLLRLRDRGDAPAPPIAPIPEPHRDRKVTLSLQEVPLRSAVDALFQGTGVEYIVGPDVPNVPVTLVLRDVTMQQALRFLLRQAAVLAPGLGSQRDGDVVLVRMARR